MEIDWLRLEDEDDQKNEDHDQHTRPPQHQIDQNVDIDVDGDGPSKQRSIQSYGHGIHHWFTRLSPWEYGIERVELLVDVVVVVVVVGVVDDNEDLYENHRKQSSVLYNLREMYLWGIVNVIQDETVRITCSKPSKEKKPVLFSKKPIIQENR